MSLSTDLFAADGHTVASHCYESFRGWNDFRSLFEVLGMGWCGLFQADQVADVIEKKLATSLKPPAREILEKALPAFKEASGGFMVSNC
jgi:hypothetical protein